MDHYSIGENAMKRYLCVLLTLLLLFALCGCSNEYVSFNGVVYNVNKDTKVTIGGNKVSDISDIKKMSNVKELYIVETNVRDISCLSNNNTIKYLFR
jgi:hypothetical protein